MPSAYERSTLADRAYEAIHRAILSGHLSAGLTVSEEDLAALAQVSRTPVRSALLRLSLEGYLERDGGRLTVRRMAREDIVEVFAVRETLECYAGRVAAGRISDAEIHRLEELITVDQQAVKRHQIEVLATVNDELHGIIMAASRNRTLEDLVAQLRRRVSGLQAFAIGELADRKLFVDQHVDLVERLRAGDGPAVAEVTKAHLRLACDILLDMPNG